MPPLKISADPDKLVEIAPNRFIALISVPEDRTQIYCRKWGPVVVFVFDKYGVFQEVIYDPEMVAGEDEVYDFVDSEAVVECPKCYGKGGYRTQSGYRQPNFAGAGPGDAYPTYRDEACSLCEGAGDLEARKLYPYIHHQRTKEVQF